MKTITKYIIALIIIALPIFAAEDQNKVEVSAKDSFINLVLEKAKLYSDKAENAISKSVDVVMEQAPIIAREYLEWNFFRQAVNFSIAAFFMIIFAATGVYIIRKDMDDFEYLFGAGAFCIALVLVCGPMRESALEMIKIKVAPRVYLIESTYDYVKSNGQVKNRR